MKALLTSLHAFVLATLLVGHVPAGASESAPDCETAIETLRAGIAVQPEQAVALFQDALQTNPGCRRGLFLAAVGILGDDPEILVRLLGVARTEFPEEDALFAEAALEAVPGCAREIREAFLAPPSLAPPSLSAAKAPQTAEHVPATPDSRPAPPGRDESPELDEEIREAIARVSAKAEGRAWPEQRHAAGTPRLRQRDEIRIAPSSRIADESSLVNDLPLDRQDERMLVPGPARIEDAVRRSLGLRLDESKFAELSRGDRESSTAPAEAKSRAIAPAGAVGLPRRFPRPRSSVYYIPPAAGSYESTIDQESGELAPPPLVIRPEPISPSAPRPALR